MTKVPPNHGKHWDRKDNAELRKLANQNTPTHLIAWKLGRSPSAVYDHASEMNVSLEPPNPWHPKHPRRRK